METGEKIEETTKETRENRSTYQTQISNNSVIIAYTVCVIMGNW